MLLFLLGLLAVSSVTAVDFPEGYHGPLKPVTQDELPFCLELHSATYMETIQATGKHVLVQFYTPECNWCKKFVSTLVRLCNILHQQAGNSITCAKFDMTQPGGVDFKHKYNIYHFPAIQLFKRNPDGSGTYNSIPLGGPPMWRAIWKHSEGRMVNRINDFITEHTGLELTNVLLPFDPPARQVETPVPEPAEVPIQPPTTNITKSTQPLRADAEDPQAGTVRTNDIKSAPVPEEIKATVQDIPSSVVADEETQQLESQPSTTTDETKEDVSSTTSPLPPPTTTTTTEQEATTNTITAQEEQQEEPKADTAASAEEQQESTIADDPPASSQQPESDGSSKPSTTANEGDEPQDATRTTIESEENKKADEVGASDSTTGDSKQEEVQQQPEEEEVSLAKPAESSKEEEPNTDTPMESTGDDTKSEEDKTSSENQEESKKSDEQPTDGVFLGKPPAKEDAPPKEDEPWWHKADDGEETA